MKRAVHRGMTLIEVLIVLAIVAIMMGAVVIGSGRTASAQQRHTATMITGAIRVGFARASATSKSVRLVMDFDNSQIWLEEGDQPMLVQTKDVTATGGASPATVAEKQALEESGRILKGPTPPKPSFSEIDPMGMVSSDPGKTRKSLPAGIKFREVQTSHDANPINKGRAYLYFWPGGQTERASIQLEIAKKDESGEPAHDPKYAVTMLVAPLTGKVTIKDGAVAIATPQDEKEASEREDPGAF